MTSGKVYFIGSTIEFDAYGFPYSNGYIMTAILTDSCYTYDTSITLSTPSSWSGAVPTVLAFSGTTLVSTAFSAIFYDQVLMLPN